MTVADINNNSINDNKLPALNEITWLDLQELQREIDRLREEAFGCSLVKVVNEKKRVSQMRHSELFRFCTVRFVKRLVEDSL